MPKNVAWSRHLDGLADEIVRLTAICDVDLRVPGNIDRVLKGDQAVCGQNNAIAFEKLQSVLGMTYQSLTKAIGRIGAEETKAITEEIVARVDKRREIGGQKKRHSGSPTEGE